MRFTNEENLFIILLGNIINNDLINYGIELPFYIPQRNDTNLKIFNREKDQSVSIKKELNEFLLKFDFSNLKGNSYIDINTKVYLILESVLLERRNNESIILSNKTIESYITNYMPQYMPFFKMFLNKQIVFNNEFNFEDIILSEKSEEEILQGLYLKVIKNLNNNSLDNFLRIDGVKEYFEGNWEYITNSLCLEDGSVLPQNLVKLAYIYGDNDSIWKEIKIESDSIEKYLSSVKNFKKVDKKIVNRILDKYDLIQNYEYISQLTTAGIQEFLRDYIIGKLKDNTIEISEILNKSQFINILLNDKENRFINIIESKISAGELDVESVISVAEITKKIKPEGEFSLIGKSTIGLSLINYLYTNGKRDLLLRVFTELKDKIELEEGQTIPKEMLPLSNMLKLYKEYNSPGISEKEKEKRYKKLCNYLELYRDNVTYDIIPSDNEVDDIRGAIFQDGELMFDSAIKFDDLLKKHQVNGIIMSILNCNDYIEKYFDNEADVKVFLKEAFKRGRINSDLMRELKVVGVIDDDLIREALKEIDGDISSKIVPLLISFDNKIEGNTVIVREFVKFIYDNEPKANDQMGENSETKNKGTKKRKRRNPGKGKSDGLSSEQIEIETQRAIQRIEAIYNLVDEESERKGITFEVCSDGYSKIVIPSKDIVVLEKFFDLSAPNPKTVEGNATYIFDKRTYDLLVTQYENQYNKKPDKKFYRWAKTMHKKNKMFDIDTLNHNDTWESRLNKAVNGITNRSRYSSEDRKMMAEMTELLYSRKYYLIEG